MNKKFLILAALPLALASCGVETGYYNKTFTYQGVAYNMDGDIEKLNKKLPDVIKEQMAAGNVDWTRSGGDNSGLFTEEYVPFEKHETYNDVLSSMEKIAKATFDVNYKDFKMVIGKYTNPLSDIAITKDGITKNLKCKSATSDTSKDTTALTIVDSTGDSVGSIDLCLDVTKSVVNGKYECLKVEYDGKTNRGVFTVNFKQEVQSVTGVSWYVWAKIAN